MSREEEHMRLLELKRELYRRDASTRFCSFLDYTTPTYDRQWFHTLIANKCQALIEGTLPTNRLMVFVPPQHGKLLPTDTPILTTQGWKKHGELQQGDYVFGQDGKPHMVIANSGVYRWKVSELNCQCGYSIECAKENLWQLSVEYDDHKGRRPAIMEASQIFTHKHRRSPYIACAPALQMPKRELPIDPYILGLWLGDGLRNQGVIAVGDEKAAFMAQFGEARKIKKEYWRIKITGLYRQLRLSGLLRNKHIPIEYLLSSVEQRTALLCGLMDTDGCCDTRGNCEFAQKKGQLADDVFVLLRTLGYKPRAKEFDMCLYGRKVGRKVRILFSPNRDDEVFRLPQKVERLRNKITGDRDDKYKIFISSFGSNEREVDGNCIQVEGGMYLAGTMLIPTHNSEIVSRKFPAWVLGHNPKAKIVGVSYSADLAKKFSLSIKRTIESDEYAKAFPDTRLAHGRRDGQWKNNDDYFDIVDYGGFYKAVGVGGSLTGTPADLGIIDDPIKDAMQAYSETYRRRVWDWYTDVFLTRLHNESKQILIMTRWHEDDLAGRLLKDEPEKWTVVKIPALREDLDDPDDPREIGEALWEERHSKARLLEVAQRSPRTSAALYQQRPTIIGGNIIKRDWFKHISQVEFERMRNHEPYIFFLDTAYTDNSQNDPTGIIATCKIGNDLYITHGVKVLMRFPDLLRFIPQYVREHGYTNHSTIRIEPKANGISVVDQIKDTTGLNVTYTPAPKDSKETRLNACSPSVECGKVVLVDGAWNEDFIDEVCGFPAKPHDEFVDVLCYAIDYHLTNPFKPIDKSRLARQVY